MQRPRTVGLLIVSICVLSLAVSRQAAAQSEPQAVTPVAALTDYDEERTVTLVVGESTTITLPRLIKVIDIKNPDLLTARGGRSPDELRITAGDTPGLGRIVVTDETGRKILVTVRVLPDISQLRAIVELGFPNVSVELHPISETSVLVKGYVDNAETATRIVQAIAAYGVDVVNNLTIANPQQVQLRLVVAEVSRTKLRQLGLNFRSTHAAFSFDGDDASITSMLGFLGALDSVAEPLSLGGPADALAQTVGANFAWRVADANDEWLALLRALKEEGIAKLLAEPILVSNSGRPASFLDGGEFAILVPQPTQSNQITYTVEFRTFGVRLNFLPTVMADGWIRLQVSAEVSEPDQTLGAAFAGSLVPGLRARRAETTVTMRSGQTLAMAGLLQRKENAQTRKVPVLGDLPIVGAAFRIVESSEDEREIVILLTPEIVAGVPKELAPAYLPGSETRPPTDSELFLEGKIERRSRQPADRKRYELKRRGVLRNYRRPGTAVPEGIQLDAELQQLPEVPASGQPTPGGDAGTDPARERPRPRSEAAERSDPPRPLSLAGPSGFDEP